MADTIRTISTTIDLADLLIDAGLPAAPVTSELDLDIDVRITGSFRPAVYYPWPGSPAEYPEAGAVSNILDLYTTVRTFYRAQLAAAGILLTDEQDATFAREIAIPLSRAMDAAEEEALECSDDDVDDDDADEDDEYLVA